MSDLGAFARLVGMGWRLARADALIPRELEPYLPAGAVALGKTLRIFADAKAKQGRPGARLACVSVIASVSPCCRAVLLRAEPASPML